MCKTNKEPNIEDFSKVIDIILLELKKTTGKEFTAYSVVSTKPIIEEGDKNFE